MARLRKMAKETVEELEVLITANADKLKLELQNTNTKLSELQNQVGGVNKSIGTNLVGSIVKANIATKVLTGILRTTANITKTVITKTFQLGSQYTRLKTATEVVTRNMGMTTEQVEGLRDALEDANTYGTQAENVIKTLALSGLVDMANGLKAIDARTGKAVEGTTALILTMKDLGATAGIDSAEAIDRLSKFVRRGEVAFADGLVEIGNINMAYKEYADSIGKSVMQLSAQERAQVRLNIIMQEGEKSLGAYAATMQTSGKATLSVGNVMTSVFERLGNYMEPVFATLSLATFEFVSSIRNALIGNAQTFQQWAITVAGYVVAVIRVLGSYLMKIPVIGKYFSSLANFSLKPVAVTLGNIQDSANGVASSFDDAGASAKKMKDELAGFDEMTVLNKEEEGGATTGIVGGVSTGLGNLGQMFDMSAMNEQVEQINQIANSVQGSVQEKMDSIKNTLETTGKAVLAFIGIFLVLKTLSTVGSAISGVTTIFGGLGKVLGGLPPQVLIIIAVITVLAGLAYIVWKNWEPISEWFKQLWENVKTWFSEGIAGITALFNAYADYFKLKIDWIGIIFNKMVSDITAWGSNLWNNLKNGATGAWNSITGVFSSLGNWFRNIFSSAWNGVVSVFSSGGSVFAGIQNGIFNTFRAVVNSLISGINTVVSIPFNAINSAINSIKKVSIAGIKPFNFLYTISVPRIPMLAKGGIIDSPTIAVVGEAGKEAVLPLDRNTGWAEEVARLINQSNTGQPIQLTVKIGDEKIGEKLIDYINEKGFRTGSNILNI